MKAIYLTTLALVAAFAVPAFADTKIIQGCEVVDKGGYYNLVDPTCQFSEEIGRNPGADLGLTFEEFKDIFDGEDD